MKSIILAGGSGERLWPLSTPENPKQFLRPVAGGASLFQNTLKRALRVSDYDEIVIVTNERYTKRIIAEIAETGNDIPVSRVVGEPEAKNTLPAILAGIFAVMEGENDTLIVWPADHHIVGEAKFADIIMDSVPLAEKMIVTFGIKPSEPETAYGYIEPGERIQNGYRVSRFREKPDRKTAAGYIEKGFMWNSGIFMFSAEVFLGETMLHEPLVYNAFYEYGELSDIYGHIEGKVSVDRGIMEKSTKAAMVPADIGWSDLGSFDALKKVFGIEISTGRSQE